MGIFSVFKVLVVVLPDFFYVRRGCWPRATKMIKKAHLFASPLVGPKELAKKDSDKREGIKQ